jgi:ClpP class serine protease
MYERFLEVVSAGRPALAPERIRELADGRVYLGPEARAHGLVDAIGTLPDAIDAAQRAAGLADTPIKVVRYARPYLHRPNVYAQYDGPAQVNLVHLALPAWLDHPAPQFLYLWAPGW